MRSHRKSTQLDALASLNADPLESWRSIVPSWRAGLPFETWATVIDQLELARAHRRLSPAV